MRNKYPQEFKDEAVRQVIEHGYSVVDVAKRLGITDKSLYNWVNKAKQSPSKNDDIEEIKRLRRELNRVTTERDILKEAAAYFANESRKDTRS
jgi:transposase